MSLTKPFATTCFCKSLFLLSVFREVHNKNDQCKSGDRSRLGQKCTGVFEWSSVTNWCQPVGFEEVVECAGQLSKGRWESLSSNAPRLL